MKNIGVYIFCLILFILIGTGFYQDTNIGLVEVEASNSCFVNNIGTTNVDGKIRHIYSYCLDDVDLSKVLLDDNTVSYNRLIQNLDEEDCLWDGGTCSYYGNNYKIISCETVFGDGDIVITTKDVKFDYIYDEFCNNELE